MIKNILRKNWYLLVALLPLFITCVLVIIFPNLSDLIFYYSQDCHLNITELRPFRNTNREIFLFVGVGYSLLLFVFWVIKKHKLLFSKKDFFRSFVVFVLGFVIILWAYSYKVAAHISYILFLLIIFKGCKDKKVFKPSLPMILLFFYGTLQLLGVLWNLEGYKPEYYWILEDQYVLLGLPIATCFFVPTNRDKDIFIAIVFKFFLALLVWHFVMYVLAVAYFDKSLFHCFVFDKSYFLPEMPMIDFMEFTIYKHQTFLSWVFLIVGGVAYANWSKNKNSFIKKQELIVFAILLLWLVFILQSRIGQGAFFIIMCFILLFSILKKSSKKTRIVLISSSILIGCISVYILINHTSFFKDVTRSKMYTSAFEYIKLNPIFGNGTLIEQKIIIETGLIDRSFSHLHSDYITSMLRHGVLGLVLLLSWLGSMFYISFKRKDLRLFYLLLPMVLIMTIDTALFFQRILTITTIFLFMFYTQPLKQVLFKKHTTGTD